MNGYEKSDLDDELFGAKGGSVVSAFDAFRRSNSWQLTDLSCSAG
jgi:hypothetical protein